MANKFPLVLLKVLDHVNGSKDLEYFQVVGFLIETHEDRYVLAQWLGTDLDDHVNEYAAIMRACVVELTYLDPRPA